MDGDWLADDPALLHDTLALIDAWGDGAALDSALAETVQWSDMTDASNSEHDESARSDMGDPLEEEPEVEIGAPAKKMVVRTKSAGGRVRAMARSTNNGEDTKVSSTNQRRRHEILGLRAQLEALQAQMAALQLGGGRAHALADGPLPMVSLWQGVAENQLRLRRQAELEQTKLRRLLDTHAAIAQGMAALMGKSQDMRAQEAVRTLKREVTLDRLRLLPHSVEQFETTNLIYDNLDAVFAHASFQQGTRPFVDYEINNDLEGEVVLAFREGWAVPFEARAVLDALWTVTLQRYEQKWRNTGPQVLVDTYEAFVAHFLARVVLDSFIFSFCGQLVLRRFAECGQPGQLPAIVTSMHSPPNLSEDPEAVKVTMQENSCLRVIQGVGPDGWSPYTHVQTSCHISVKFDYADPTTGRFFAGLLANFVLARLKADADVKRSTVEGLLMRSHCASP